MSEMKEFHKSVAIKVATSAMISINTMQKIGPWHMVHQNGFLSQFMHTLAVPPL